MPKGKQTIGSSGCPYIFAVLEYTAARRCTNAHIRVFLQKMRKGIRGTGIEQRRKDILSHLRKLESGTFDVKSRFSDKRQNRVVFFLGRRRKLFVLFGHLLFQLFIIEVEAWQYLKSLNFRIRS